MKEIDKNVSPNPIQSIKIISQYHIFVNLPLAGCPKRRHKSDCQLVAHFSCSVKSGGIIKLNQVRHKGGFSPSFPNSLGLFGLSLLSPQWPIHG